GDAPQPGHRGHDLRVPGDAEPVRDGPDAGARALPRGHPLPLPAPLTPSASRTPRRVAGRSGPDAPAGWCLRAIPQQETRVPNAAPQGFRSLYPSALPSLAHQGIRRGTHRALEGQRTNKEEHMRNTDTVPAGTTGRSATLELEPATMMALVYPGPGKRTWEEKPRPRLQAPTDAIVRITTTTICGTDLHILKG